MKINTEKKSVPARSQKFDAILFLFFAIIYIAYSSGVKQIYSTMRVERELL